MGFDGFLNMQGFTEDFIIDIRNAAQIKSLWGILCSQLLLHGLNLGIHGSPLRVSFCILTIRNEKEKRITKRNYANLTKHNLKPQTLGYNHIGCSITINEPCQYSNHEILKLFLPLFLITWQYWLILAKLYWRPFKLIRCSIISWICKQGLTWSVD